MHYNLKNIISLPILVIISLLHAEKIKMISPQIGAYIPHNTNSQRNCISDRERQHIMDNMLDVESESLRDTVLFRDPVGNGGMMNGDKQYITNYVDQNPSYGWIEDYTCYFVTYDGHWGTDIAVSGFYHMDEMTTPILAAARGIVTYTHDGEFDRWTYWSNDATSNTVGLSHSNGIQTFYLHMKKNSVAVSVGDTVEAGDTLGFVGSSGFSDGPHLHFEVNNPNWNLIDPWEGDCSIGASRWLDQIPHIGDSAVYPQRVFRHLNTAYPAQDDEEYNYIISENIPSLTRISPGEDYMSLVAVRNLYAGDTLIWRWYKDGTFVDQTSFVPGQTQWWYQGAPYYATSYWWINNVWFPGDENVGSWEEKVFINSVLVGEKSFICDTQTNQTPTVVSNQYEVELGQTVSGEFEIDDDGEAFWFNLESNSTNGGLLEIFGGKRRKFTYTAPADFVGTDYIGVSAIDDRGVSGPMSYIIFNVTGVGLIDMEVNPSYVRLQEDSVNISAYRLGQSESLEVKALVHDEINNIYTEIELSENDENWGGAFFPEVESFFSVDFSLINNDSSDTTIYEDMGYFTSIGPLTISFSETLTVELGGNIVSEFSIQNNSDAISVSAVSVSFIPENEECISSYNSGSINIGDIGPGETVSSDPEFFIALLEDECDNSVLEFKANIRSNQIEYWVQSFELELSLLFVDNKNLYPEKFQLHNAYPNPFNPVTTLRYDLPEDMMVYITIYDMMGRVVNYLVSGIQGAGHKSIQWDSTNNKGKPVSAGLYIYTIEAGNFKQTKKMLLLK